MTYMIGLNSSVCFFIQTSNAWGYVGHLAVERQDLSMSSLHMASPTWQPWGGWTSYMWLRDVWEMQKHVTFYHLALESCVTSAQVGW